MENNKIVEEQGLSFGDIVFIIKRNILFIALVTIIFTLVGAFYGLKIKKPSFTATSTAGVSGYITVSHGSAQFKVMVTVGQLPVEITGFETDKCGTGAGQWRNTQVGQGSGSCEINTDLQSVKYGEKSLKINFNLAGTTGTVGTQIGTGTNLKISGTPTAIGMWVYATPSSYGAWIRIQYAQTGSSGALYADFGTIDWEGWKYLEAPIDATVKYPISIKYLIRIMGVEESQRLNGVIYVDQLRAVYGFSNDDFENPVISNIIPSENGLTTTTTQTISFDVTDTLSGVNKDATQFYLDGNKIDNILFKEIQGGYNVSWTPSSIIPLNKGKHTIKVRVEDNYQNFIVKEWTVTVNTNAPSFELNYENEINTNSENTITLKASSLSFKSLKFELNYNNTKVEIIEVLVNTSYEQKAMTNENGILNIELLKLQLKDVQNPFDILYIKYKTLVDGEIQMQAKCNDIVSLEDESIVMSIDLDNVNLTSSTNVNYDNFIDLVNKINKDNVLSSLKDLMAANEELNTFNRDNIDRTDVLQALEKLDECNEKYTYILECLNKVDQSSNNVGKLLGGK